MRCFFRNNTRLTLVPLGNYSHKLPATFFITGTISALFTPISFPSIQFTGYVSLLVTIIIVSIEAYCIFSPLYGPVDKTLSLCSAALVIIYVLRILFQLSLQAFGCFHKKRNNLWPWHNLPSRCLCKWPMALIQFTSSMCPHFLLLSWSHTVSIALLEAARILTQTKPNKLLYSHFYCVCCCVNFLSMSTRWLRYWHHAVYEVFLICT